MKYKFLIYISYSYAVPIGNPLETEIIKRGFSVQWFSNIEDGKNAIADKLNVFHDIKDVIFYKPDIVLAATDEVPDFITGLKVQIFHGFFAQKRPTKNNTFYHFRIRGFFDLYCTQGPSTTREFQNQSKIHRHFEVIETGWSKVDPLFPLQEKSKSNIPTIMIASTFTKRLSLAFDNHVFSIIKKLSESGAYNFIMVLHPKLPNNLIEKWKGLENDHFKYYDTTELVPLFKKADVLLADTTSAIQEFIIQEKPVVTFKHTIKQDYLIQISEADKIEEALKYALCYPSNILNNIQRYITNLHPYYDGKSSKRVIDATIDFLHKDKKHLKRKPLNLIRKYKLRKQLNYFTWKSYNQPFTINRQD